MQPNGLRSEEEQQNMGQVLRFSGSQGAGDPKRCADREEKQMNEVKTLP